MSALLDLPRVRTFPLARCKDLAPSTVHRRFFTAGGEAEAVAYCLGCVERVACGLAALEEERDTGDVPHGVRGGLTAAERVAYLRKEVSP